MSSLVPRAACPGTGCDKEIQEHKGQVSKLGKQRTVVTPWELCPAFDRAWAARQAQGEGFHFPHRLAVFIPQGSRVSSCISSMGLISISQPEAHPRHTNPHSLPTVGPSIPGDTSMSQAAGPRIRDSQWDRVVAKARG